MEKEQIIVGTPVIYWSVKDSQGKKHYPKLTKITSEAWALGSGHLICNVEKVRGGVSIEHLEPATPEAISAAGL